MNADFAPLVEALGHEARHLALMIALLEEEQRDLVAGETDRLEAIAAEKLVQVRALDLYAARRKTLLDELGVAGGADGVRNGLARSAPREAAEHWDALLDRADQARTLNTINGRLVADRLASVHTRLSRLCGAAPSMLYGPDGRSVGTGASRTRLEA